MRMAEEALRRPILRGLGHLATASLMEHTIKHLDNPDSTHTQDNSFTFQSEVGRGRIHRGTRGELVAYADKTLRRIADTAFCMLQYEKERELYHTFWDISQRVRDYSEMALDHRLGSGWRELDPASIAQVKVEELNDGQKLSRYDRHLLIKTKKPLDIHTSFGNAVATTAEFAAISIEAMHRSLSQAGCHSTDWYPHSFANINKLSFGARLPFWAAQDFAIAANNAYPPPLFRIKPGWPDTYHVSYAKGAHQQYIDKGTAGACQGILPQDPKDIPLQEEYLREHFLTKVRRVAKGERAYIARYDHPKPLQVTSVDAATALTLAIAYKGQYRL